MPAGQHDAFGRSCHSGLGPCYCSSLWSSGFIHDFRQKETTKAHIICIEFGTSSPSLSRLICPLHSSPLLLRTRVL